MGKCPPSNSLLNSIPSWLGHEGTSFAKVTLLCVSQSILFPFVYVVLFPGITISGRIEVDFCLSITFPAEIFHSFTSPFQEALWKHPSCSGKVILEGVTALSFSSSQAMVLTSCRTLGFTLDFSEPFFPQLENGDNDRTKEIVWIHVPSNLKYPFVCKYQRNSCHMWAIVPSLRELWFSGGNNTVIGN